jgi:hypothetical protein
MHGRSARVSVTVGFSVSFKVGSRLRPHDRAALR